MGVVRISEHLTWCDGLYCQLSVSSGLRYWSSDGNEWHGSPEAARRAA
jgi:hypothetical protein